MCGAVYGDRPANSILSLSRFIGALATDALSLIQMCCFLLPWWSLYSRLSITLHIDELRLILVCANYDLCKVMLSLFVVLVYNVVYSCGDMFGALTPRSSPYSSLYLSRVKRRDVTRYVPWIVDSHCTTLRVCVLYLVCVLQLAILRSLRHSVVYNVRLPMLSMSYQESHYNINTLIAYSYAYSQSSHSSRV